MNKEEAIRMLKAKLECMTRDVSGRDSDCIDRRCDECSLNYEQGNMGEQKEWLRMAIEALEQPKTGHWLSQSEYCKINNLIPSGLGCYFWCSECNCGIDYKYFHLVDYNYCPKCGAKMQGVQK